VDFWINIFLAVILIFLKILYCSSFVHFLVVSVIVYGFMKDEYIDDMPVELFACM